MPQPADTPMGKELIKQMIRPLDSEESFSVQFPSGISTFVSAFELFNRDPLTRNHRVWADVLETAMLDTLHVDGTNKKAARTDIDFVVNRFPERDPWKFLTGHAGQTVRLNSLNEESLSKLLDKAFSDDGRLGMVADASESVDRPASVPDVEHPELGLDTDSPILGSHAYTVAGYDPALREVYLRNPHAEAELDSFDYHIATKNHLINMGGGWIAISLSDFKHYFSKVSIASADLTFAEASPK